MKESSDTLLAHSKEEEKERDKGASIYDVGVGKAFQETTKLTKLDQLYKG